MIGKHPSVRLLALDTATAACSVALWRDGAVLARRFEAMLRGQSEALMPMVGAVLAEAGCGFNDLDAFAVTVGPGAFTGLRIGLAAARGMALAADLPLIGVTTLEAVVHGVPPSRIGNASLLAALDSKRDDIYLQPFDPGLAALAPPAALMPAAIEAALAISVPPGRLGVVGDAADRVLAAIAGDPAYRARVLDAPALPDAAVVARLAAARLHLAVRPGTEAPAPLYLRPADAAPPRRSNPSRGPAIGGDRPDK